MPIFQDSRGCLAPIDFRSLPFVPQRAYFLFDTKELRGGHAHRNEREVFICIRGNFRAKIHDGRRFRTYRMNHPGKMLYTDALVWHEFDDFSPDAILLALSSTIYNGNADYILNFQDFLTCKK